MLKHRSLEGFKGKPEADYLRKPQSSVGKQ
jgi:hypothetical protein